MIESAPVVHEPNPGLEEFFAEADEAVVVRAAREEIAKRAMFNSFQSFFTASEPGDPYHYGKHTNLLLNELNSVVKDMERGECVYLIVNVPPRHGKSDLASRRFPAWVLDRHPDWEFILASYNYALASDMSLDCRKAYRELGSIHNRGISKERDQVGCWRTLDGGALYATGIGGTISGRGANCLCTGTLIQTEDGLMSISDLVRMRIRPKVLSQNHKTNRLEHKSITAVRELKSNDIYIVRTERGRKIRATGEHHFFVPEQGYTPAHLLRAGDVLRTIPASTKPAVQNMWRTKRRARGSLSEMLFQDSSGRCGTEMHLLRKDIRATTVHRGKSETTRTPRPVLFSSMFDSAPRNQESTTVHFLRAACGSRNDGQVLSEVQKTSVGVHSNVETENLSKMRTAFPAEITQNNVLFQRVCESGALDTDAWEGQFTLQEGYEPPNAFLSTLPADSRTRQEQVLSMSNKGRSCRAPHRRRSLEQFSGQSDYSMPPMPYRIPQDKEIKIEEDRIISIQKARAQCESVYDIQVEDNHNFFAEGILVHNCMVIDDYLKGREDAESLVMRDKVWDAFRSDLMTRRAPIHAVIIVANRWHEDDLVGRILAANNPESDSYDKDFPKFRLVRCPAWVDPSESKTYGYSGWLFPERFNETWYKSAQALVGSYAWDAQFQQDPKPRRGNRLRADLVKRVENIDEAAGPGAIWEWGVDLAHSDKELNKEDPDYTHCSLVHVDGARRIIYIKDVLEMRKSALKRDAIMKEKIISSESRRAIIEVVGAAKDAFVTLKEMLKGVCLVHKYTVQRDLTARASYLEPIFEAGNVVIQIAPWNKRWEDWVKGFPNGAHDDAIASLVAATYKKLAKIGGSRFSS